jgi:hypothetical protein
MFALQSLQAPHFLLVQKYGKVFRVWAGPFRTRTFQRNAVCYFLSLLRSVLVTTDPTLVKTMLVTDKDHCELVARARRRSTHRALDVSAGSIGPRFELKRTTGACASI